MKKNIKPSTPEKLRQKQLPANPLLFARFADNHIRLGKLKPAGKILDKGVEEHPDYATGWLVKGFYHLKLKQLKPAREAFERALKIDPDIPSAHLNICDIAQIEEDLEAYIEHLRALNRLEVLDDNLQIMLQTALLRKTAIDNKILSKHAVMRMIPNALRALLLEKESIPPEIKRQIARMGVIPAERPIQAEEESDIPKRPSEAPEREPLAWDGMKFEEEEVGFRSVRMVPEETNLDVQSPHKATSGETEEVVLRVSWADALSGQAKSPFLETSAELYEATEDESAKEFAAHEADVPDVVDIDVLEETPASEEKKVVSGVVETPPQPEIKAEAQKPEEARDEVVSQPVVETPEIQPAIEKPEPPLEPVEIAKPAGKGLLESRISNLQVEEQVSESRETKDTRIEPAETLSKPEEAPAKIPHDETPILRLMNLKKESLAGKIDSSVLPPEVEEAQPVVSQTTDEPKATSPFVRPRTTIIESPLDMIMSDAESLDRMYSQSPKDKETEATRKVEIGQPAESKGTSTPESPPPPPVDELDEKPLPVPPEIAAREEEARRRLAEIAGEVTKHKAGKTLLKKPEKDEENTGKEEKPKNTIATKTLAELYASQNDWAKAVDVYEELLRKFPSNEAYRKRMEQLRAKIGSGAAK